MKSKGLLLVITGPSGSGKDSIMNRLIDDHGLKRIVTYTSRLKRKHEVHGVDYHFVERKEFELMIEKDLLIEHVTYGLDYKGTHKDAFKGVLEGERNVWIIKMSRAATVKELIYEKLSEDEAHLVWKRTKVIMIDVPDWKILDSRIITRGDGFNKKDFLKRLEQDKKIREKHDFKYVVRNMEGKFEETIQKVKKLLNLD